DNFSAKGLQQAKEKLDELRMSDQERIAYQRYLKRLMDIASEQHTKQADMEDILAKKRRENMIEVAINGIKAGLDNLTISTLTHLSDTEIENIRNRKSE
ncbi:MAG: hypothetical protein AAF551_12670, partial [Bacteroidota bacterium]